MLPRVTNFNSIKVQLEPEFGLYKSQIDDFNSIKVQLEHKIVLKTTSVLEFQFHKGTIRTLYNCRILIYEGISIP